MPSVVSEGAPASLNTTAPLEAPSVHAHLWYQSAALTPAPGPSGRATATITVEEVGVEADGPGASVSEALSPRRTSDRSW